MIADTPAMPFRLGVTLHSFTEEYCSFVWSFEDLMQLVSHLGGGVEIVGPAHQRGFPHLTAEFESSFRSSVVRNKLTPTSYGSYADPFMLPDRDLTHDEIYRYTLPQLDSAARLGFPIVRLQHFTANIAERLLPVAEKLDLTLGYELHVPMTIESERGQFLIDQVRRIGSPRLGIIPDAGIFARSISRRHLRQGLDAGLDQSLIQELDSAWHTGASLDEALALAGNPEAKSPVRTWIGLIWDTFGRSEPSALLGVMPYIVHFHGKFFTMVDGDEPDLRYEELVQALVQGGYQGWISSEFEGAGEDSFEAVAAHHAMIERYASPVSVS
jgi:sugar phosphate isomerase/epimerase